MTVDPAVRAVAQALYGDAVRPEEFAKSLDTADVHVEGTTASRRKKALLAGGLVAGTAIEAAAAKETIAPLRGAVRAVRAGQRPARTLVVRPNTEPMIHGHPILPKAAGEGTKAALQGGNALIGVAAAKELVHPKKKVAKGVRVSLKPIAGQPRTVRSLRAVRPAGSPAAVAKSFTAPFEISKIDSDRHEVFGWANVSVKDGQEVLDRQGDLFPIGELENAAYDYVLDSRVGGDQHERIAKSDLGPKHTADLIESMVFTPEKIAKLGLPADFPQGWWVGYKVHDEQTWQEIKKGKRTGFSVHGSGRRTPINKAAGDSKRARVRLVERARQAKTPPPVKRADTPASSAVRSIGYQRQTRKLDVQLRSREQPYSYRVKPETAQKVIGSSSLGRAYTSEVRGKAPHHTRYTVGDRARLFAQPERDQ